MPLDVASFSTRAWPRRPDRPVRESAAGWVAVVELDDGLSKQFVHVHSVPQAAGVVVAVGGDDEQAARPELGEAEAGGQGVGGLGEAVARRCGAELRDTALGRVPVR